MLVSSPPATANSHVIGNVALRLVGRLVVVLVCLGIISSCGSSFFSDRAGVGAETAQLEGRYSIPPGSAAADIRLRVVIDLPKPGPDDLWGDMWPISVYIKATTDPLNDNVIFLSVDGDPLPDVSTANRASNLRTVLDCSTETTIECSADVILQIGPDPDDIRDGIWNATATVRDDVVHAELPPGTTIELTTADDS